MVIGRMTGAELAVRRHLIGLTPDELADVLDVNPRTVRSWESGRDRIPARIPDEVEALVKEHGKAVALMVASDSPVGIARDKGDVWPSGWYVAAAARAMSIAPDLGAVWCRRQKPPPSVRLDGG